MDRFAGLRIVDSDDDSASEEEPTLRPHAPQAEDAHGDASAGSAGVVGAAKDVPSAGSPNDSWPLQQNYIFPPPEQPSGQAASHQSTPRQEEVEAAVAPDAMSPDPRSPEAQVAAAPSVASSHRSRQSETPSAAQVSIKASSVKAPSVKAPSLQATSAKADTASAGSGTNREVALPPPASPPSVSAPLPSSRSDRAADAASAAAPPPASVSPGTSPANAPLSSAHSAAEAPAAAAEAAEPAVVMPLSPVDGSQPAAAQAEPAAPADPVPTAAAAPPAAEAAAAEPPKKKEKASAGCSLFSSSKKKQKEASAAPGKAKKEKSSGFCGLFSKKAKEDTKTTAAAGAEAEVAQPPVPAADALANEAAAASQEARSADQLSIPVAEQHSAAQLSPAAAPEEAAEPSEPQEAAEPSEPQEAAEAAGERGPSANDVTGRTGSSLSFAVESEAATEQAAAKAEEEMRSEPKSHQEEASREAAEAEAPKERQTKRVKAVVRRKRQKPDGADAASAKKSDAAAPVDSDSDSSASKAQESSVAKSRSAKQPTPRQASAAASSQRREEAGSASVHSGSYSSYGSYSGSYSYSYSYSASSERSAAVAMSHHSSARPAPMAPPPAKAAHSAASLPGSSAHGRQEAAKATPLSAGPARWSVRADDLILREEDPPASMPAYQRRILLDLRERERRDAEEAARDLQNLTFRPRIHAAPGQTEKHSPNIVEEAAEERGHSPMSGGRGNTPPAPGAAERSPRRYSLRHISPHLLTPRKAPPQPALPSFKPEITDFARREVSHDRSVFHRLYDLGRTPPPTPAPEHAHTPEISAFAKQLYPVPRGTTRLPSRRSEGNDANVRRESVFDRLYRQRNSPGTSPNTSPSRSAARPPSFHPQITEMARRQSEGVAKEPVGDRLYRQARSPRREQHSPYTRPHEGRRSSGQNSVDEEVERNYATGREYGVAALVPQSDRASWTSSSLQSSFSMKGPDSAKGGAGSRFSANGAAVAAV